MRKFVFDPISAFVWLWLFVVNGFVVAANYLFAIFIHEFGHYIVANKLGYKVSRMSISPYGVELAYFNQNMNYHDEFWVAIAGPAFNLVSSLLVCGLWWIIPSTYFLFESFVFVSLVLALINMFPAYPLDGGRIFICLFSNKFKSKKIKKFTIGINILLSIIFFSLFVWSFFFNFNPTFLFFSIFLFCGVCNLWNSSKYEKINALTKQQKSFTKPIFYVVYGDETIKDLIDKIESSKTYVFCLVLENGKIVNLSEKFVVNLSINFGLETKLCEIIKK